MLPLCAAASNLMSLIVVHKSLHQQMLATQNLAHQILIHLDPAHESPSGSSFLFFSDGEASTGAQGV